MSINKVGVTGTVPITYTAPARYTFFYIFYYLISTSFLMGSSTLKIKLASDTSSRNVLLMSSKYTFCPRSPGSK